MSEKIIKQGNANWFSGIGSKGGKLILTNENVYFEGHLANLGKKEVEINLKDVIEVKTGFLKNLIIRCNNNNYEFVVNGKKDWKSSIEKAMQEK